MGAEEFQTTSNHRWSHRAFREAVESAQYNYGHAGYTGTIAEKDSFVVIQFDPIALNDAQALADKLLEDNDPRIDDKWGPAGAIPFFQNKPGVIEGWLFFGWAST